MRNTLLIAAASAALVACGSETAAPSAESDAPAAEATPAPEQSAASEPSADEASSLAAVLAAQPDETKARYQYRNPEETLTFFGVEPGMTVVDVLPGGGWYGKILLPYLGADGALVGADYSVEMWPLFGGRFSSEEALNAKKVWVETWTADAEGWRSDGDASVNAFQFGAVPEEMKGTADVVMMIRAFHHLNRFEEEGGFRTAALAETFNVLKPGGTLAIVQHRAPEGNDDKWAEGDNGYVKQSTVIAAVEAAGFELVEASEINANPNDQPTTDDVVWRLPPSLAGSKDDEERRAAMQAIGESDRMTLKFRKPS
ncbi:MAG: methyltransferase [Pseudomonadota bacterium]